MRAHYDIVCAHISPKGAREGKELAYFRRTFEHYARRADKLMKIRVVLYLFLYASILGKVIPDAVAHLLIASIVSAPAALVVSFLMVPPQGGPTPARLDVPSPARSAMDAVTRGTVDGLQLLLSIVALLIVLVALGIRLSLRRFRNVADEIALGRAAATRWLAEHGWRDVLANRCFAHFDRAGHQRQRLTQRVLKGLHHLPVKYLRVRKHLGQIVDGPARHFGRFERSFCARVLHRPARRRLPPDPRAAGTAAAAPRSLGARADAARPRRGWRCPGTRSRTSCSRRSARP